MVQGLEVSVLGIFITFLALGVFILIMVVLQKLFPARREEPSGGQPTAAPQPEPERTASAQIEADDPQLVAAIAAAVTLLRARQRAGLGASLGEGRSAWWTARRQEARQGGIHRRQE